MNVVFMGTPTFALPALNALAENCTVSAVFTRPDAASHRGRQLLPSLVKARAQELGIPVYTPQTFYALYEDASPVLDTKGNRVVDAEILAIIEQCQPTVIVVAAYGLLLPPAVLELAPAGCLNIHASLLPRWRGAAPIQRALLANDEQIGVSIMRMDSGLDTGQYCLQASLPAAESTYQQLIGELGALGADLLTQNLERIVANKVSWKDQDLSLVTYADKVEKGSIDLNAQLSVRENYNRVRASSHHARCRATLHGKHAMVLQARPALTEDAKRVYFTCADGLLEILTLKPDGSREMTGTAFLAGLRSRDNAGKKALTQPHSHDYKKEKQS